MTDNRTTELTATERLRALLDERGVEYETADGWWTSWDTAGASDVGAVVYCEDLGSGLEIRWHTITPEQAIATLGNTTCEYVIEDNMNESEGMGDVWFRCTNCGTCYDYYADDWLFKMPHCPKCGAAVKGVR